MTVTTSRVPAQLSATLVELVDLQLLAKQLHWTVAGAPFRPPPEQFDELAEVARTHADAVAERCVLLGVIPDGQSLYVAEARPLDRIEAAPIKDLAAAEVGVRMLDFDPVTQDVLVEAGRDLEQQLVLLRAHEGPSAVPIRR